MTWSKRSHHLPVTDQAVVIQLLHWIMRGVAQVMFINNPLSGILITAGLFLQNLRWAQNDLLDTLVSTVSAVLLRQKKSGHKKGWGNVSGFPEATLQPSYCFIFTVCFSLNCVLHYIDLSNSPPGCHISWFTGLQWNLGRRTNSCFLSQRQLVLVAVTPKCVHHYVVVSHLSDYTHLATVTWTAGTSEHTSNWSKFV